MKVHTTNYYNTFIQVADDCPTRVAQVPPRKEDKPTLANLQFDLIAEHPYQYTSDDIVFGVHAIKQDLTAEELDDQRKEFFSKGQPCLRTSPLTKRYGWGIHYDNEGRVAVYGADSDEYSRFSENPALQIIKAIRSKKA